MSYPNYRLSPAASKQRHRDDGQALISVGFVLGMAFMCIVIALAIYAFAF